MPDADHLLERRSKLLASRLGQRRDILRDALAPTGTRPPFTEQLNKPAALAWWRQHRHDDLGKQVLERMTPQAVLELDVALSRQIEDEQLMQGMY